MAEITAPPAGELFSKTNDNPVAILLTYGTACVLLAGDAEVRKEYIANGPCEASSDYQRSETTHTLSQGSALY